MRAFPAPAAIGSPRFVLRASVLASAVWLGALAAPAQAQTSTLGNLLNKAGELVKGQQPAQPANNPALLQQLQGQVRTQIPPDLAPLFIKGTVNGEELIGTLRALQRTMRERRAALQMAVLVGAADAGAQAVVSGNFNAVQFIQEQAVQAAFTLVRQVAANAANQALDQQMMAIIDDPKALAAERITLPSPVGLNAQQAKRIITMAALVVGARVSTKMLERAQKDLEGLRKDYKELIDQREKAANLLFAAIAERAKAQQAGAADGEKAATLHATMTADDLRFIDQDLSKLSVRDFAKDMAAQNLALNYLKKAQPEAFASYRTQADDVVLRTKSYLRTMTGIAAFGAITANFMQSVGDMTKDKRFEEFVRSMPLVLDFMRAATPLMKVTVETATTGVALGTEGSFFSKLTSRKRNFVYALGEKSIDESSAQDVFKDLGKSSESTELFKGALFRSDSPGLLQRVGECDRAEAGRMLDATTSKDEREAFANHYFDNPEMAPNFSFYSAMESPGPTEREQLLAGRLLAGDYRDRASFDMEPVSKVQKTVSAKYTDWSDQQLMRLIFANKETPAKYATLYVGEARIKPMPTADSLFAYETSAEACKKLLVSVVHGPAAVAPASKPAVKANEKAPAKPPAKPPVKKESK